MVDLDIQPVGLEQLASVGQVFGPRRATRHCWCMAFCSNRRQFALGWYGGGNRRRFEAMAVSQPDPMGVVALRDGEPQGWCACGPRSRYAAALSGRSDLLSERPREEDDDVWLIACIIVRPDVAAAGVLRPLLRGAISLARNAGAAAVEAWPLAAGVRLPEYAHVGREAVFAHLGFTRVAQPRRQRVIMRLDLVTAGPNPAMLTE